MKKLSKILLIMLVMAVSCQKEVPQTGTSVITWSVSAPVEFTTKAAGEADEINVLWYGVYHKKEDGSYKYMSDMSAFVEVSDIDDIQVPVTLVNGQCYKIVFAAQHRYKADEAVDYTYIYNIDESGIIKLNPAASVLRGEQMDLFVYLDDEVGPVTGSENRQITLTRPVAQICFGTSSTTLPEKADLSFSGAPSSYDIFAGKASTQTKIFSFKEMNCSADEFTAEGKTYKAILTFYTFGSARIDCKADFRYADATTNSLDLSGVTTQTNYKTNILGNY